MRCIEKLCDTLTKISGQLRGPLASLGGSLTSERGHWAFSENSLGNPRELKMIDFEDFIRLEMSVSVQQNSFSVLQEIVQRRLFTKVPFFMFQR